jgi:hypothetical protein
MALAIPLISYGCPNLLGCAKEYSCMVEIEVRFYWIYNDLYARFPRMAHRFCQKEKGEVVKYVASQMLIWAWALFVFDYLVSHLMNVLRAIGDKNV